MKTTEEIRENKLAKIILSQAMEDPNTLGEALLKYAFVGEGRGCYSNFELRPSFRLWREGMDKFSENLVGPCDIYSEEEYEEEVNKISSYIDAELDLAVAWLWSGDGSLIFKLGDVILQNTDIKKSHNWKFVDSLK